MARHSGIERNVAERPLPPGFEEIQREEGARVFGQVTGARLAIAPIVALVAIAIAFFDVAPWRRVLLIAMAFFLITISIIETIRFRRHGFGRYSIPINLGAGVLGQLVFVGMTGGIESPLLPMVILLALFAGTIIEFRWVLRALIGLQIAAVWLFATAATQGWIATLNPDFFGGGGRAGHSNLLLWTAALALSTMLPVAARAGVAIRGIVNTMLKRGLEAREESLAAYAERNRELITLGGEIAHELKNPLASVSGLAALLARDVSDDKSTARLAVLRQEVARMHGILDEFLTFSRPLVPLALEVTDLWALAREVMLLHEGMAHERGVTIELHGAGKVECDPRKVKQILINLVQNGLEVSPSGGCLEIVVRASDAAVELSVLDRGRGLNESLGERVFEPGVTTKARGSGLGLTIARSLARQHRGDLTLLNRSDGSGCVATLRLPLPGAADANSDREKTI